METESDESSLSPAAVTAHLAKKPLPRPRGAASHAGTAKAFDKRVRITEQQKAETVQQIMTNPSMSYTDLGEWYKEQYKLDKAPSNAVICQWLKPEKRKELLQFLAKETCAAKLDSKSKKLSDNPEMEEELFDWFRRHEQRQAVITDCVLQVKAKELCQKRKITFKASRSWVRKFKLRHGIGIKVLHGEAGSADRQWVSVARAVLPTLLKDVARENIWNADETGYFFRALPRRTLAVQCRKELKIAKDRITVMLACNASGTQKMNMLVIGTAKRPRCFGKSWQPTDHNIFYEYNKTAWMDGKIFSRWAHEFNRMQIRKFGRESDMKAWLLLDNSSTHVLPDNATETVWDVDGFKLRGFIMSHTNAVFALANTTSETQALDAGIIANVKLKGRTKYVEWVLERLESEEGLTADKCKPDVRQAMMWFAEAWQEVTKETIVNCWNHTKTLPCASAEEPVIMHDTVLDELKQLLLDFGAASHGEVCTAEEYINIEAEQWIEAPDSDDDESPLAAVLAECDEPSGQDACEDDSVEVKVMSLKEARAAAAELKLFLEENKRKSQDDMKKVCADLSRMTVTARHVQPAVSAFFGPAPANRDPV